MSENTKNLRKRRETLLKKISEWEKQIIDAKKELARIEIEMENKGIEFDDMEEVQKEIENLVNKEVIHGKRERLEEGFYNEKNIKKRKNNDKINEEHLERINKRQKRSNKEKGKEIVKNLLRIDVEEEVNVEEIYEIPESEVKGLIEKYISACKKSKITKKAIREEIKEWYEYYEDFEQKMKKEKEKYPKLKEKSINENILRLMTKSLEKKLADKLKKNTRDAKRIYEIFKEYGKEIFDKINLTGMKVINRMKKEEWQIFKNDIDEFIKNNVRMDKQNIEIEDFSGSTTSIVTENNNQDMEIDEINIGNYHGLF